MNMKMPDFNVKKLVKEAGNQLSRVVQLTEEKLGTSEKTELDSHYEMLAERSDSAKKWTEKILSDTEAVLIPNPGNRAEDFIFEKIEKKKPTRLSNLEYCGLDMIEAGAEFGSDGPYGSALTKVGQAEQKLGQCERDFIGASHSCFIQPLRRFLDGEMKTISKERGILESKRLDLDACKNRVRKARSMLGQQTTYFQSNLLIVKFINCLYLMPRKQKDGISPEQALDQAERELRVAQSDFDRQAEITKLLLENISTIQSSHLRHLHAFVEAQSRYHANCVQVMNNLQRDLASMGGSQPYIPVGLDDKVDVAETVAHQNSQKRARVLCSYDAADATELNLTGNEVIFVTECNPPNADYMFGKQGLLKGLVPRAFLELLDD